MENETGVLRTLLIALQSQLDVERRLFQLERAHKSLSESVLAHLPNEVHQKASDRFDDLIRESEFDNSPHVYGIRQAISEIQDRLKKKG